MGPGVLWTIGTEPRKIRYLTGFMVTELVEVCWQLWRELDSKVLSSTFCSMIKTAKSVHSGWESSGKSDINSQHPLVLLVNSILVYTYKEKAGLHSAALCLMHDPGQRPDWTSLFLEVNFPRFPLTVSVQPHNCIEGPALQQTGVHQGEGLGDPLMRQQYTGSFCFVFWGMASLCDPGLPHKC